MSPVRNGFVLYKAFPMASPAWYVCAVKLTTPTLAPGLAVSANHATCQGWLSGGAIVPFELLAVTEMTAASRLIREIDSLVGTKGFGVVWHPSDAANARSAAGVESDGVADGFAVLPESLLDAGVAELADDAEPRGHMRQHKKLRNATTTRATIHFARRSRLSAGESGSARRNFMPPPIACDTGRM